MLIPSIDLMGGRIVQLVRGEKLKLAFDDFDYWIERFSAYPLVQLIDLDAAMRHRASQKHGVQRVDCRHVVDKLAAAAQKTQIFKPFDGAADGAVRRARVVHMFGSGKRDRPRDSSRRVGWDKCAWH